MYENELYHYGVKGMKWGVRKSVKETVNRARANYRDGRAHVNMYYARNAKADYDRYSSGKSFVSKTLTKINEMSLNHYTKRYEHHKQLGQKYVEKLDSTMTTVENRRRMATTNEGYLSWVGPTYVRKR